MIWSSIQSVAEGKAQLAWVRPSTVDFCSFYHILSDDERLRAARFLKEEDRKAFIAGRVAVRLLLADRLRCGPHTIRFLYSEYGRPNVADGPDFNISHSGDHVLVALARDPGTSIGIDVECLNRETNLAKLEPVVLSGPELEWLNGCQDRHSAFLRLWVMKEAVLKAAGTGLSTDPRLVHIDPQNLRVCWPAQTPYEIWQLYQIDLGSKIVVALTVKETLTADLT